MVSYDAIMWRYGLMLFLLALAGLVSAQDFVPPRFISVDTETDAALPNAVISSLAEDRDGFLWAGNARGVMRFDGQEFRQYSNHWSAPFGETSLFVRTLLVGKDGTLWVGSDFVGLIRYDRDQDTLMPVTLGQEQISGFSITAMVEDDQGRLWVGTDGSGLAWREPDGQVHWLHHQGDAGLPDNRITSLLLDRNGTVWVGTWKGLAFWQREQARFVGPEAEAVDSPWNSVVMALYEADDGQLWVGAMDGQLWHFPTDRSETWVETDTRGSGAVHAILQVDEGTLWVGRAEGIEIRAAADGSLRQRLRHQAGNPWSLASNEVRSLLRDRGGQVWVGSYGGGLQRHNPHNAAFRMLDRHVLSSGSVIFEDPSIRSIQVLADGQVLLGTQTRGIFALDANLAPVDVLRDEHGQPLFQGVRVTALAEDVNQTLWIGSDAGLFRRRFGSSQLESIDMDRIGIRRLLDDRDGGVWIGTEGGLWYCGPDTDVAEPVLDDQGEVLRRNINALGQDRNGRLWVGGEFGLGQVLGPGKRLQRVTASHPARGGDSDILGLLIDAENTVWLDTPSGLYRLHPERTGTDAVEAISLQYGAAGQPFGANVLMDAQGRIWSQDNLLDRATGQLLKLGSADGIGIGSPWFRAYAKLPDGRLLFGGTNGLLVVRPEAFQEPAYNAPLVLTSVRINGESLPPASVMAGLELKPDQHRLEIEFAALDYSAPASIRYAYRLLGESSAWIHTDASHRLASFANLAPGDYRFELFASNRHGRAGQQVLALPLVVYPAWWQRWWVRGLGVLALFAVGLVLMRQRTRWLRARQHELERNVAERTQELQDVSAALHEKTLALEEASRTDPLTGLRNRRFFSQRIEKLTALALERFDMLLRQGQPTPETGMVLFLFDIDHFKKINDQYGHAAGDAILQQLAMRLRDCFRGQDDLMRWGGEEFLVLAQDLDSAQATDLAERAIRHLGAPAYTLPDQRLLRCSCSLGYASFPLQTRFPRQAAWEEVLELADRALYAAKAAGRFGWVGILADETEPLAPNPSSRLPEELAEARLVIRTSLSHQRVHEALIADQVRP